MKTIQEIAIEKIPGAFDPDEILPARAGHLVNLERRGFIEGAAFVKQDLTRWRDPKKEQPEDGATVLGKTSDTKQPFAIMKYYNNIWWIWAHPCWAGPSGEVIGWRPIYD